MSQILEFCEKCNYTGSKVDSDGFFVPCDCVPKDFLNVDMNNVD